MSSRLIPPPGSVTVRKSSVLTREGLPGAWARERPGRVPPGLRQYSPLVRIGFDRRAALTTASGKRRRAARLRHANGQEAEGRAEFTARLPDSPTAVIMRGIHHAGSGGTLAVFSPLSGINKDLGTVRWDLY